MKDFTTTRRGALNAAGMTLAAASLSGRAAAAAGEEKRAGDPFERFEIGEQRGLDSLQRVRRPRPEPGHGEVLVRTCAAALNHRDLMVMEGRYGQPKARDLVLAGDGAGEVVAVGPGVSAVMLGTRVTAPHFTGWTDGEYDPGVFAGDMGNARDGWLAEYVLLPAVALVEIPDALDYVDAAALGAAGITAWHVLVPLGNIKAGDLVLTLGTGGVSILALQIARMSGARVAITSSSDEKLELARSLGAEITVNYRSTPDWGRGVRDANGGRGADIVVETVGLTTLPMSLQTCAPNARVGLLGALGGRPEEPTDLFSLITGNIVLKGITSGSRRMLSDLLTACAANGVKPHIDRRFAFAETPAALAYLKSGGHVGKVVIEVGA
jgi:NADPH:quinone reductase-like Zn-dependent oxidoreductase